MAKRRLIWGIAAGALLLAGGGVWLWSERTPIASSYIDEALRAKGVPASYRLTRIGVRRHRIEAIRIGDPAKPDLVADWAEIELAIGFSGVRVRAIDAGGVRLRGRFTDGKLSLGSIDRLLPEGKSDQPFALPDIDLTARAMRFDLATSYGSVLARLDGRGELDGGFRGALSLSSTRLEAKGCGLADARARFAVAIDGGRPSLNGPVSAVQLDCAGAMLRAPRVDLRAQGGKDLMRWRGNSRLGSGALTMSALSLERIGGLIAFDASTKGVEGTAAVTAEGIRSGDWTVSRAALNGRYGFRSPGGALFAGDVHAKGSRLDDKAGAAIEQQLLAASGTPVGPILAAWGRAARRASRAIDATARLEVAGSARAPHMRIERVDVSAEGGGQLSLHSAGGAGLGWDGSGGGLLANLHAELKGGGFPVIRADLSQSAAGAPVGGEIAVEPYRQDGAMLAFDTIRLGRRGDRMSMSTVATISGPLADGRVERLRVPVAIDMGMRGDFAVNRDCAPVGFDRIGIAGTEIGRSTLRICPVGGAMLSRGKDGQLGGGMALANPRLRGRLGEQPLTLAARSLAVDVGRPGFRLDALAVRLGTESPTRLDVGSLSGTMGPGGMGGSFDNVAGNIGAVPLLLSGGAGSWRLAGSVLSLDGSAGVTDAESSEPRFRPLQARDIRMTLKEGRIDATAMLHEPRSGAPISAVSVRHDSGSGAGNAVLDVASLRFGKSLQPEAITPLTLGMIANVEGALSGRGDIRWNDAGVTSDGTFSTEGLDFAAAFGPVTGLKGIIRFTDLLGMVTAADQQVTIAEINPGVAVTDGVIRYRLLPEQKLEVLDGIWPFAGGRLLLEPALLDMGQPVARRLTFRIDGLDAAAFVQQLEFKNLAVTGKFDGVLPIVFDSRGGRIERGELAVRPEGGTLSYVGDVTNANLGRMARIAFDALKSMRYRRLTIELNGDLDGEIVSKVRFDGTNDKPEESARSGGVVGRILAPIMRLPFRFNITITAPFRGLVNSAQTFIDPSIVLRNTQAGMAQPVPAPPASIQPQ